MRSDHWNFLANLLGTPGPAEPPKEESKKEEHVEPAPPAQPKPTEQPAAKSDADDESEVSQWDDDSEPSEESVLDALKTIAPQNILPGFISPVAEERSDVESSEQPELDSAWSGLAAELGVDPQSEPPARPARTTERRPPERSSRGDDRTERVATGPAKKNTGFGSGLGIDLGPEPEQEAETDEPEDTVSLPRSQATSDEVREGSRGDARGAGSRGKDSRDRDSRDRDLGEDRPRAERPREERSQEERPRGRDSGRSEESRGPGRDESPAPGAVGDAAHGKRCRKKISIGPPGPTRVARKQRPGRKKIAPTMTHAVVDVAAEANRGPAATRRLRVAAAAGPIATVVGDGVTRER